MAGCLEEGRGENWGDMRSLLLTIWRKLLRGWRRYWLATI
ncbi:MAG: hypothetical protein H6R04_801 [Burkholderiaceae bacterium]|nr:hypothetical protein [Burkholderiaceae bacterium]